jgi:RimJ/RimL family protein N-acetyltransferase
MKTPVLETERLILRPVTMDDAPSLQKHFNNWNIIRRIGVNAPWPYPEDGAESFLKMQQEFIRDGKVFLWTINLKDKPNEAIGLIEFRFREEMDDNRGFWLSEDHWGHGYMSEAVEATQDWIFFELGKDKVIAKNAFDNVASRRVKEKTGARHIGQDVGKYHEGEKAQDIWEITAESWRAYRNG